MTRFRNTRLILSLLSALSSGIPVMIFTIGGIVIAIACLLTGEEPEDLAETIAFCVGAPLGAAALLCGAAASIWLYVKSGKTGQMHQGVLWLSRLCLLLPPLGAIAVLVAMHDFDLENSNEIGIYSQYSFSGAIMAVITWFLPTKPKANPSESSETNIKE